ncbi:hypothetical protein SAMN05660209_04039 [Geodermatophilus africanus]|uniref:Lipoprotein n=1 Tax=Geodermatophilus africanus TaxID=1137993 RepID=A0A1H3NNF4_9ACTN|nr:hypothetical protein [Geodermatophilus africanus]SDY90441.1 hypothetical protein SAMN05660209_04039 [Geodermatophilus africanus]
MRPRWLSPAAALAAALLAGCAAPASLGSDELACRAGDDGEPARGVVLMAQAVPSASWLPCLDAVPLGWRLAEVEVRDGSGGFWLDSDRDGVRAIEARLTEACNTRGATEIPSDREGLRRLELVTQVHPQYVGTRFYVFDGGCLAMVFRLDGDYRAEPLAVATESIDVVRRADVAAHVHEESGGRLHLDGPAAEDGAP